MHSDGPVSFILTAILGFSFYLYGSSHEEE